MNRSLTASPAPAEPTSLQPWLVAALLVAAAAHMAFGAFADPQLSDLAYLIAAGRSWAAGLDPYAPTFLADQAEVLAPDAIGFVYPPSWWLIAVPLGALEPARALVLWKALNLLAAAGAAALFARSARRLDPAASPALSAFFTLALFTATVTGEALRLGQTSLLMLLGFALLLSGLLEQRRARQVAGLVILMLKPQLGLFFLPPLAMRKDSRPAALWACLVTGLLCLPVLLLLGPTVSWQGLGHLLGNLGTYAQSPWNSAANTSGIGHFLAYPGLALPPPLALLAGTALLAWLLRQEPKESFAPRLWLVGTGLLLALVPLHAYDFVLFFPALLLLGRLTRPARALLLSALLLILLSGLPVRLAMLRGESLDALWAAYRFKYDLLSGAGLLTLAAALVRTPRLAP